MNDVRERFCGLDDRVAALERELAQWKANHDNQVKLKRAIAERPDLKERAELVQRMADELAEAKAMLGRCAVVFRSYERLHREKGTEEGNRKADKNGAYAKEIEEWLKAKG